MICINKSEKIAILIDFDGTITVEDTNDKLVANNINEKIKHILTKENELNYLKFVDMVFDEVKITEKEYLDFILGDIAISEGFIEFFENTKLANFPIAIVSGGFDNGIIPFLKKHGITGVDVYANRLNFNGDNIIVTYYDGVHEDCCDVGPCGNCKIQHYEKLKGEGYKVIFIGDGITDQAVATVADVVFAKDGLLKYCEENNIDYIPWKDFKDVNKIIFKDNQLI